MAERVWIQQTRPGRSHHEQMEAGDRRWAEPVKVPHAQHVEYRRRVRAHTNERRATEVAVTVHALNRMLDLGRPSSVRVA